MITGDVSTNLDRERSVAPIDLPHVFSFTWGYDLPWGPGKHWLSGGGAMGKLGKVVGGWQMNGIATKKFMTVPCDENIWL